MHRIFHKFCKSKPIKPDGMEIYCRLEGIKDPVRGYHIEQKKNRKTKKAKALKREGCPCYGDKQFKDILIDRDKTGYLL